LYKHYPGLYPIPIFQPKQVSLAGPHRLLSFVSWYLGDGIEGRPNYNLINIDPIQIRLQGQKGEEKKRRQTHRAWTDSFLIDSRLIIAGR
jgi:hypothetical protein